MSILIENQARKMPIIIYSIRDCVALEVLIDDILIFRFLKIDRDKSIVIYDFLKD